MNRLWRVRFIIDTAVHPDAITPSPWNYQEAEPVVGVNLPQPGEGVEYEVEEYVQALHATPSEKDRAIARLAFEAGRKGVEWDALLLELAVMFGDPGGSEPKGILNE